MDSTDIQTVDSKTIETSYDIHPLLTKRWSPRSFDGRELDQEVLFEIFEGASLAASAFNEQPWKYAYASRGSNAFDAIHSFLSAGNKPWTAKAGALVISIARKVMTRKGKYNAWAEHDVGMANAQLLLQAVSRDVYGHCMAGFDKDKVAKLLKLNEDEAPICVIALGYKDQPEMLQEPYLSRELAPRSRKKVNEFVTEISNNVQI